MADYRQLALNMILADGEIDDAEVRVLRRELWADGVIDEDEVKFLIDLRNAAQKKAKSKKLEMNASFERLFFKAIEENVLKDGAIDASEVRWLRKMLFADNKIDEGEKKFLQSLAKKADRTVPSFDKLYEECVGEPPAGKKPATKKKKK